MIWLIPLLPLLGAIVNGLTCFARIKLPNIAVASIASGVMIAAFGVSVCAVYDLAQMPPDARHYVNTLYPWIEAANLKVNIAFAVDPLSSVMLLVITGIGSLIHLYAAGYMAHDEGFQRFFTWLNLFVFFMLLLVLGDNVLLMFVGWEGVGLCSYLLIGFWFHEKPNAVAGMKAFVVNRVGDFAFILGFCLLYWALVQHGVHTLTFSEIKQHAHLLNGMTSLFGLSLVTVVTLLFFIGATGKSAQIPLYVWLPDAMAGPTPVSALIHAATMVTAGIYMIGRTNFLFTMAPLTMHVVATVGVVTALFAGTIGLAQNDIKKVLAYSTVSQLGYMFLGMGVGAFSAGVMHLMTHAFFKGLMFLGAGSVIHAMHHEQDMRKMGGLKDKIPWTFWTFMAGYVAIIGTPFTSGFISKDEILWQAFNSGAYGKFLWFLGWLGAGTTAFYMSRLVFMTFFGKSRVDHHTEEHLHESPPIMIAPLVVLALLSIVGGAIGWPHALGGHNAFEHWLSPVFAAAHEGAVEGEHAVGGHNPLEYIMMLVSVGFATLMVWLAWNFYGRTSKKPAEMAAKHPKIYQTLLNKYYVDEFYEATFVRGLLALNKTLAWFDFNIVDGLVNLVGAVGRLVSSVNGLFDRVVVDGLVNFVGWFSRALGTILRRFQTGKIENYVYVAVALMTLALILRTML